MRDPRLWPTLWGTEVDWAYRTVPQVHTAGRVHDWPRGRVVGGTSCLNAMQYIRGHRADYDAWAAAGNTGWGYADVLPHFVDLEDFEGGPSELHGVGGPVHVSTLRDKDPNPTSTAFVEACLERGYPANDDFNGATTDGAGWGPTSIKDGVRQDTWTCFLAPVADRPGLTVRTGAQVARLVVDGGRVTGVELVGGERIQAIAPGIVHPRSRGGVRLLDATPGGALAIDPNYLAEDGDVAGLLEGIALSRDIGAATAFAGWRAREVLPGPDVTSPAALREFVARAASTYYHPAGTCAMGTGEDAVVDPALRVRGVEGLRVADASIMPTMVSVNPNATITMIGAKAAALITGHPSRPAEHHPHPSVSGGVR